MLQNSLPSLQTLFYVVLHVFNYVKLKNLFSTFPAATRAVCSNFVEHYSLLVHLYDCGCWPCSVYVCVYAPGVCACQDGFVLSRVCVQN